MFKTLLLLSSLLAGVAQAGAGREALEEFRDGLQTLSARFQQTVFDTENGTSATFDGLFQLSRPDRFRWDYEAPEHRRVIADGRDVWVIDDDLNHITQLPQSLTLKDTPAMVLLSNQPIDSTFEVREMGERIGRQWLELLPHNSDGDVVRVALAFEQRQLVLLEIVDKFGQTSRFSFYEIQRNPALSDAVFEYEPPEEWAPFQAFDSSG